jgi:two-component SAPR family response regulator
MNVTSPDGPPRILVVDDEALIAMFLERELLRFGCTVVGPAGTVGAALKLICDPGLNGALLDVNLRGELVYPVADALVARGVPFVFVSGYATATIDSRFDAIQVLPKPLDTVSIRHAVNSFDHVRKSRAALK